MPKRNNGFTLLELIIVIFLMTLILGLSLPFFAHSLPSNRFNTTVRDIVATIRHARVMSQSNNAEQAIFIDLDSKYYGIEGQGSKAISSDINIKVIDPFSGEIYSGKCWITFRPTGSIDGGTIVLWTEKKTANISLDPIVGAVVVR